MSGGIFYLLLQESFRSVVSALAGGFDAAELAPVGIGLELFYEGVRDVEGALLVRLAVLGHGVELCGEKINLAELLGVGEHAEHAVLEIVGDAEFFHGGAAFEGSVLQFAHGVGQDEFLQVLAAEEGADADPVGVLAQDDALQ